MLENKRCIWVIMCSKEGNEELNLDLKDRIVYSVCLWFAHSDKSITKKKIENYTGYYHQTVTDALTHLEKLGLVDAHHYPLQLDEAKLKKWFILKDDDTTKDLFSRISSWRCYVRKWQGKANTNLTPSACALLSFLLHVHNNPKYKAKIKFISNSWLSVVLGLSRYTVIELLKDYKTWVEISKNGRTLTFHTENWNEDLFTDKPAKAKGIETTVEQYKPQQHKDWPHYESYLQKLGIYDRIRKDHLEGINTYGEKALTHYAKDYCRVLGVPYELYRSL